MHIRLFLAFVLACFTCGFAGAQTAGGDIDGTVVDESGNPAAEVTITIENSSTDRLHTATTDENGRFHFESLPAGEYEIATDLGQSEPAIFEIRADRVVRIELQTTSGGASAEKATLQVVPVDSDTGQITTTFSRDTIKLLPQPNYMSPGDGLFGAYNQSLLSGAVVAPNPIQQAHGPIVAGMPALSNNFHVDGVDNNNRALPGPLVYLSNEATSDFSLQQNADSPRFGHAAGGQLNSIVSSGANEIHGAVYWYLQNRELNALEPRFDELNVGENPRYDQHRIGATAGFPIIRDKLFALANFEYIPLRFERTPLGQALVPTQAGLASLARMPGVSAQNLEVIRRSAHGVSDPVESVLVNGTAIPLGFASTNMFVESERYMGTGALDWTGTQNDQVSGRYVHNKIDSTLSGATLPAFATPSETTALLASVGYTRLFGPNIANNLRVSYNRLDQVVTPGDFQFGGLDVFPNVQIQGLGLALGPQAGPDDTMIHTFQLGDSLSISRGAHQFRAGVDGRRILSSFSGLSSFRGDFTFSTLERFLLDQSPDVVAQRSFGDPTLNGNQWLWLFYVQDTWKLTPHVNLELGLSSQYASIPEALRRQRLNGDLSESGLIEFTEPEVDNFNFAPRVGVAYSPNRTTVFRAGAGMEYDALSTGMLPYLLLSPTLNIVTVANPLSQQASFFAGGGVPRPIDGRARVSSFFGNQELPYVIHWNVGAQKGVVGELTVEAKYLGNRSVRLPIWSRLNDISRVTATNSLPIFVERPSTQTLESLDVTLQSLRGAPSNGLFQTGFTNPITTLNQGGTSMYHALMVGLRHRFSRGLHLTASYTYSDAETDTFSSPLDFSLPDRERFDAPWDQEHRLVATGILDLESLLEGTPGFVRAVVANFSLMGTYTYASEQSIPIVSGIDTTLSGNALGSAAFFNPAGTSDRGTGVTPLMNRTGQTVAYLANDPEARFVQGGFGTVSRQVPMLPLDQTSNLDFAAVKRFGYREVAAFELRLDAYNIFNHRQFTGNLIRSIENPLLGLNGATALPAFLNPGSAQFGNLRGWLSGNPRTLQVALRVSF